MFFQPHLESALRTSVEAQDSVAVSHGWEAIDIEQSDDHVVIHLREGDRNGGAWQPTGALRTVRARYLVGADGANSTVRRACGIGLTDLGFSEDFIVIDVRPHQPDLKLDMPEAAQLCDPIRPVSLFRWLGREHARWEFMMLDPAERERAVCEFLVVRHRSIAWCSGWS